MSFNLMNVRCKMLLYSIRKYNTKPNYVLIYQQFNFCIRVIFHINHFIQLHDIFLSKLHNTNPHERQKYITHWTAAHTARTIVM